MLRRLGWCRIIRHVVGPALAVWPSERPPAAPSGMWNLLHMRLHMTLVKNKGSRHWRRHQVVGHSQECRFKPVEKASCRRTLLKHADFSRWTRPRIVGIPIETLLDGGAGVNSIAEEAVVGTINAARILGLGVNDPGFPVLYFER